MAILPEKILTNPILMGACARASEKGVKVPKDKVAAPAAVVLRKSLRVNPFFPMDSFIVLPPF
jgi:hypothetical protein